MTRVRTREWSSIDYYAVLGVAPEATATQLDQTYRELAKALHPDRNPDPEDQEQFKRIGAAYSTLRDPGSRAAYDEFRARVAAGTLYVPRADARTAAPQARANHLAPVRVPKPRNPMPAPVRTVVASVLVLLGLLVALWAVLGDLPTPTDADTPLAVQITLAIMALKLVVCGAAVAWYPQLRTRWHR